MPYTPDNLDYGASGSVESNAYKVAETAENTREKIMDDIRSQLGRQADGTFSEDITLQVQELGGIDISSGAGALVLDDVLQKLSTIQQSAAQILASKNRGVKEMQQLMR